MQSNDIGERQPREMPCVLLFHFLLLSARQNKTKSLLLRNDVYLQSSIEAKAQIPTALTT